MLDDLAEFLAESFELERSTWERCEPALEKRYRAILRKKAIAADHARWLVAPPLPLITCVDCGCSLPVATKRTDTLRCDDCRVVHRRNYRRKKQAAYTAKRKATP